MSVVFPWGASTAELVRMIKWPQPRRLLYWNGNIPDATSSSFFYFDGAPQRSNRILAWPPPHIRLPPPPTATAVHTYLQFALSCFVIGLQQRQTAVVDWPLQPIFPAARSSNDVFPAANDDEQTRCRALFRPCLPFDTPLMIVGPLPNLVTRIAAAKTGGFHDRHYGDIYKA